MFNFTDSDKEKVSLQEKTEVNSVLGSGIVHSFGFNDERHSAEYTINELLLLSLDKGLKFNTSEKGISTFQNFECFTGKPPERSRQEEGRVRKALSLVYAEIDQTTQKILSNKMPRTDLEGAVAAWNQERQKLAKMIEDKVINTLSKIEIEVAGKYKVPPPKRSSATVSVITCRYDKVKTAINNQEKVQMTDSMLNFLGKPISTSSSSSSSSSFKKASSSRKLLR